MYQNDDRRNVQRRKGTAHDEKQTTTCVKHGGGSVRAWAHMAANGDCITGVALLTFSKMLQNQ